MSTCVDCLAHAAQPARPTPEPAEKALLVVPGAILGFLDSQLMEYYPDPDPDPDPELGVEHVGVEVPDGMPQSRYRVAHLEQGREVAFNFVVAGGRFADWRPRSFDKEGDVEFRRRDVVMEKEDQEHVQPVLTPILPDIVLPPHVRPVVRLLDGLITDRLAAPRCGGASADSISGDYEGDIRQVGTIQGGVTFAPRRRRRERGTAAGDDERAGA